MCWGHYNRKRRYGDPLTPPQHVYRLGDECAMDGCRGKPIARELCSLHYERWSNFGDPLGGESRYHGDDIGYFGAHHRVRAACGDIKSHLCVKCGAQAAEWSYDHKDPDERIEALNGFPYSIKVQHYRPMCRSCHRKLDNPQAAKRRLVTQGG